MNKQKLLALISHIQYETHYTHGDVCDDLVEALTNLLEQDKPTQAFQRYYLYYDDHFLHTALSLDGARGMAQDYLKLFPTRGEIRINTLDGFGEIVGRDSYEDSVN